MRCEKCGTENLEGNLYCKECRAPLSPGGPPTEPVAPEPRGGAALVARFLYTAWSRKGPILIALFVTLMMAVVFALIHISEPTRLGMISYAVFCLKKKNK